MPIRRSDARDATRSTGGSDSGDGGTGRCCGRAPVGVDDSRAEDGEYGGGPAAAAAAAPATPLSNPSSTASLPSSSSPSLSSYSTATAAAGVGAGAGGGGGGRAASTNPTAVPVACTPFRQVLAIPRAFLGFWTSQERRIPGAFDVDRRIVVRPCVHVRDDIAYPLPELMYVEFESNPGDGRKPYFVKVRFNGTVGTFEARDVRQRIVWTGWAAADATARRIVWFNKRLSKELHKGGAKKKRGRKSKRELARLAANAANAEAQEPSMVWQRRDVPNAAARLHSQVIPSLCRVKLDPWMVAPAPTAAEAAAAAATRIATAPAAAAAATTASEAAAPVTVTTEPGDSCGTAAVAAAVAAASIQAAVVRAVVVAAGPSDSGSGRGSGSGGGASGTCRDGIRVGRGGGSGSGGDLGDGPPPAKR